MPVQSSIKPSDDCGLGGQPDSLVTGHAGKRIACAVIGYASPLKK
jgi:Cu-Zn family superoxide dismutase